MLGDYSGLEARVKALRAAGRTGEEIAEALNREGYHPPRDGVFTGNRVRKLFMRLGLADAPAGVGGPADLPGEHERWLPDLAAELGVNPIVVHRWRWSGKLHARQLAGANGRWIVWADGDEVRRLRRLRAYEVEESRRTAPRN
jgi:hypothetical protein